MSSERVGWRQHASSAIEVALETREEEDGVALELPGCENTLIATFTGGPTGECGLTMHCEAGALRKMVERPFEPVNVDSPI